MEREAKEGRAGLVAQLVLPAVCALLHVLCIQNYGYFRDELYYLACSKHMDWGYVDHPPLTVAILRAFTFFFGDGLAAVRAPVVLASATTVWLVIAMAKRFGASGWGLWLAGVCPLLSGMFLVIYSINTMNPLDITLWALATYIFGFLLEKDSMKHWILLGIVLGLAFLNKASVLWLVSGLGFGILLTGYRKTLMRPGPWVALAILALIASPHLIWQARMDWPTAEFATNARNLKMIPIWPWDFFAQQAVAINIVSVPLIVAGIVYGIRSEGRKWAPLAISFLIVVAILLINGRSRVNYLAPAYPVVMALGAVAVQRLFEQRRIRPAWVFAAYGVSGPFYLALGLPWLPPRVMTEIIEAIPIKPPLEEKGLKSPMQGWSDMFGWPELVLAVQQARDELSPEDRERCAVVTFNYGEAAALEHWRVKRVLCGHNNYWLWGPQDWDGKVAVFVHEWPQETKDMFESFREVGRIEAPNAVPEANGSPVWIARGLKVPVPVFWQRIKKYL